MAYDITFDRDILANEFKVEHWLVEEGEAVQEGQQLLSVRAKNKLYVIHAPISGIFVSPNFKNGEFFEKDDVLGEIVSQEEAGDIRISDKLTITDRKILDAIQNFKTRVSPVRPAIHVKATPSARRAARQEKVDLEQVAGTGPDGRIQLADVLNFVKEKQKKPTRKATKEVLFGLPLSPIAERMVRLRGIDKTKIPAPPGATRIRRKDVEFYLKEPETAKERLEEEYGIITVPETFQQVSEENILESSMPETLLPEPEPQQEEKTVIRLTSEEGSSIKTGAPIRLGFRDRVLRLLGLNEPEALLNEPTYKSDTVIRLTTDEVPSVLSDQIIILGQEEEKEKSVEESLEEALDSGQTLQSDEVGKIVYLSSIANLDLLKVFKSYSKEYGSIGAYLKNYLLAKIQTVFKKVSQNSDVQSVYIGDITAIKPVSFSSTDPETVGKELAEERELPIDGVADLTIVDLLPFTFSNVSGLIDPHGKIVLYLSYLRDLERFFRNEDITINSILTLSLEFDSAVFDRVQGIELIMQLIDEIEEKGEQDG